MYSIPTRAISAGDASDKSHDSTMSFRESEEPTNCEKERVKRGTRPETLQTYDLLPLGGKDKRSTVVIVQVSPARGASGTIATHNTSSINIQWKRGRGDG